MPTNPRFPRVPNPIRAILRRGALSRLLPLQSKLPARWLQTDSTELDSPREHVVSLRKDLKDEARRKRAHARSDGGPQKSSAHLDDWELTVGIEIHAELNTTRKLFSPAPTFTPAEPNANIALFDLAYPGTQPKFQKATLIPALRAAIALNCNIQRKSTFDRKHYFYQDQPAGYQITQYYEPFARDGHLILYDHDGIAPENGKSISIGIKQIQMEQDTAKTIAQPPSGYLLDFNRVSHPLIEIISLPHIHQPSTAAAFVKKIQTILKAVDAATAGMEIGGLRADVNVSVRWRHSDAETGAGYSYHGVTGLGQRTEIKNLSSFKAVEDAIIAERDRQIRVLEAGGVIEGETRGWTLGSTETRRLRGKEGEVDYRYMPDPDLPPVVISDALVENLKTNLPLLPDGILEQLADQEKYGLTMKDAKTLLSLDDGARLEYHFQVVDRLRRLLPNDQMPSDLGRIIGNWVLHDLGGLFSKFEAPWAASRVPASKMAELIASLLSKQISGESARLLLQLLFDGDRREVAAIIAQESMAIQEVSDDEYAAVAQQIIDANPEAAKAVMEKGRKGKAMWFVGQVIREMAKKSGQGGVQADRARAAVWKILNIEEESKKEKRKK